MIESTPAPITLKVLFFGAAKDAVGAAEITLGTDAGASVQSVKETVFSKYPPLDKFSESLMVAVNEEYARNATPVKDGDVVAFLPPVSGG